MVSSIHGLPMLKPSRGVARIMLNVPFLGDAFDVVFKANRRNYILLNSYLAQPQRQRGLDIPSSPG